MIPESDYQDLFSLYLNRKQYRRKAASSRKRAILAFDTEADKGDIFLIACSDGNYLDEISAKNVLDFLFRYQESWNFFFAGDYDWDIILKLLPENILKTYLHSGKLRFEYAGYTIRVISKKMLSIMKGHKSAIFYDIAQFYPGKKLIDAYEENIGAINDVEYYSMKNSRKLFTKRWYNRKKKSTRKYCIDDCVFTRKLGEHWVDTFHATYGFYPAKWLSAGYLAEKVLNNNNVVVPLFREVPIRVQNLAFAGYIGGRIEMLTQGFVPSAFQYDVNAAYPKALEQIPDLTNGRWVSGKRIQRAALLGFFRIIATVGNVRVGPFPFRHKTRGIIFPTGTFETVVTLDELRAVQGDSRISYTILDSHQFIPNKGCRYPFRDFILAQYRKKQQLGHGTMAQAVKIIINSIYGKTGQHINDVIGNLFNPAIFAQITGYTRAQLYRTVLQNGLEAYTIAFGTDSITTSKPISGCSPAIGGWKIVNQGWLFQAGNGLYHFEGKKWKTRGFGMEEGREIDEYAAETDEGGNLILKTRVKRTHHIRGSLRRGRIGDIGIIEDAERKWSFNADVKRVWLGQKLTGAHEERSRSSVPINLDYITDSKKPKVSRFRAGRSHRSPTTRTS